MDQSTQAALNRWLSALAAEVVRPYVRFVATPGAAATPAHRAPATLRTDTTLDRHGVLTTWSAAGPFLRELSGPQQEVLRLHLVEGLSYGEIARQLGISLGTVHSRIARARERLRAAVRTHEQWVTSRVAHQAGTSDAAGEPAPTAKAGIEEELAPLPAILAKRRQGPGSGPRSGEFNPV